MDEDGEMETSEKEPAFDFSLYTPLINGSQNFNISKFNTRPLAAIINGKRGRINESSLITNLNNGQTSSTSAVHTNHLKL